MNLFKETAKRIFCSRVVASMVVDILLRVHNIAYYFVCAVSQRLEPNNLHPKHRLMDYHTWFSSKMVSDWIVLDIGCGYGALAADLSKHCKRIVAIDIDRENIKEAEHLNQGKNIKFITGDATVYPFRRDFDAIILSNVLEHIEDRIHFLKNLSRISDIFLIRVPMIDRDWITLYKKERGIPYLLDQSHFIEYTADQFRNEISEAGLTISKQRVRYGELYAVCNKKINGLK